MQDFLSKLLWDNDEIPERAARLCAGLPGFAAAEREYSAAAEQIQALVGYERFDRFQDQLLRYTGYEVRAYYALGLGLREALTQALEG